MFTLKLFYAVTWSKKGLAQTALLPSFPSHSLPGKIQGLLELEVWVYNTSVYSCPLVRVQTITIYHIPCLYIWMIASVPKYLPFKTRTTLSVFILVTILQTNWSHENLMSSHQSFNAVWNLKHIFMFKLHVLFLYMNN